MRERIGSPIFVMSVWWVEMVLVHYLKVSFTVIGDGCILYMKKHLIQKY